MPLGPTTVGYEKYVAQIMKKNWMKQKHATLVHVPNFWIFVILPLR